MGQDQSTEPFMEGIRNKEEMGGEEGRLDGGEIELDAGVV